MTADIKKTKSLYSLLSTRYFFSLTCAKGLTLIEVLGAIVVLSVVIALVMTVVAGSIAVSRDTEATSRNIVLCARKIDETKAKILGRSLNPLYQFGWNKDYDQTATAFPAPDTAYKYTVSDPNYPAVLIRDITVTVWYDADNDGALDSGEKSITLNTKVTKRD